MPDPDTDAPGDTPDVDDKPDTPDLGDPGKAALAAERKARRDAEKAAKELQAKLKEFEDRDKSDSEKTAEALAAAEKRAADAEAKALRLEVAASKELTPAQAKRLVGTTQEELEADADEILEAFPAKGATPPPSNKPKPDIRGGGDPTGEPTDVKALVDSIPSTY